MKKLYFCLLIIISLGILSSCSSGIKFIIGFDKEAMFGIKEFDGVFKDTTLEMVRSVQDLKDLCDEWGNNAFQESSEYYSSELGKKIRSYDEVFFDENVLIIYSFWRDHGKETRIDSIEVDGEKLIINARYIIKRGTFDDVSFTWLFLIEANKADILDAKSVEIKSK